MIKRRNFLLSGTLVALAPLLPDSPALAGAGAGFAVQTVATGVAAKSDRRAMAGGLYDPVAGKTFISWTGENTNPYVAGYDHATGTWTRPIKVGQSPKADSHHYPVMIQARDGRLLVFYGSHNTVQRLATSQPHTVEGDWTDGTIDAAPRSTYPMPVKASNGDIYLFFRSTPHNDDPSLPTDYRPIHYVLSTDDGRTWTHSSDLEGIPYAIGSTDRPDNCNEIYIGEIEVTPPQGNVPERFHFVWTLAGGGPGRHEHDYYHRNLYYAAFQPGDRHFYNAAGDDLGAGVDCGAANRLPLVLETELKRAKPLSRDVGYTHLVGSMAGNRPVLLFMLQDGDTTVVHAAAWQGHEWRIAEMTREATLFDKEQISPTAFRVYANPADGTPAVYTYILENGSHWRSEARVRTPTRIQRANLIAGFRDPARVVLTGSATSVTAPQGGMFVLGTPAT
jgi:hypothetical protein